MTVITCDVFAYAGDAVAGVFPIVAPSIFTGMPAGFEVIENTLNTAGLAEGNAYGCPPGTGFPPPPPPPPPLLLPPPPHDVNASVKHENTPASQTFRIDLLRSNPEEKFEEVSER
jgi:hypothetical protein